MTFWSANDCNAHTWMLSERGHDQIWICRKDRLRQYHELWMLNTFTLCRNMKHIYSMKFRNTNEHWIHLCSSLVCIPLCWEKRTRNTLWIKYRVHCKSFLSFWWWTFCEKNYTMYKLWMCTYKGRSSAAIVYTLQCKFSLQKNLWICTGVVFVYFKMHVCIAHNTV